MLTMEWMNYFAPENSVAGTNYRPGSRLGVVLAVLFGRKKMTELNNDDFMDLGFKQEVCQYTGGKDVTADTILRLSNEREVKFQAEKMLGTLICNLISRCETLNARVANLEAKLNKETKNA